MTDLHGNTDVADDRAAPSRRLPWRPRLGSLRTTRQTMARLFREWAAGTVADKDFRTGTWALGLIVSAYRIEMELSIEKRLQAIEDTMKGGAT